MSQIRCSFEGRSLGTILQAERGVALKTNVQEKKTVTGGK